MKKPKFNNIVFENTPSKSPASINLKTGVIYINSRIYNKLTALQKSFVLWHEYAHYKLQTKNEFKADEYAFNELVKQGHKPKNLVLAISEVLSGNSSEHYKRLYAQYNRAKAMQINANKVSFFGKKVRERRQDRKDKKLDIKAAKVSGRLDNKNLRIQGNNETRVTLAEQGISEKGLIAGHITGAIGQVAQATASAFGVPSLPFPQPSSVIDPSFPSVSNQIPLRTKTEQSSEPKNKNMYIVAALVVLVLLGGFFVLKNKIKNDQ